MRIRDLSPADLLARLGGDGIRLAAGPFNCRLQSGIPEIADELARLYAHHPLVAPDAFVDFHVGVGPGRGLRRWLRPQAVFSVDGVEPFTPLPRNQALRLAWAKQDRDTAARLLKEFDQVIHFRRAAWTYPQFKELRDWATK